MIQEERRARATVHHVVRSKRPGSGKDYEVLATTVEPTHAEDMVRRVAQCVAPWRPEQRGNSSSNYLVVFQQDGRYVAVARRPVPGVVDATNRTFFRQDIAFVEQGGVVELLTALVTDLDLESFPSTLEVRPPVVLEPEYVLERRLDAVLHWIRRSRERAFVRALLDFSTQGAVLTGLETGYGDMLDLREVARSVLGVVGAADTAFQALLLPVRVFASGQEHPRNEFFFHPQEGHTLVITLQNYATPVRTTTDCSSSQAVVLSGNFDRWAAQLTACLTTKALKSIPWLQANAVSNVMPVASTPNTRPHGEPGCAEEPTHPIAVAKAVPRPSRLSKGARNPRKRKGRNQAKPASRTPLRAATGPSVTPIPSPEVPADPVQEPLSVDCFEESSTEPAPRRRTRWWIGLVLVSTAAVAVGFAFFGPYRSRPATPARYDVRPPDASVLPRVVAPETPSLDAGTVRSDAEVDARSTRRPGVQSSRSHPTTTHRPQTPVTGTTNRASPQHDSPQAIPPRASAPALPPTSRHEPDASALANTPFENR